MELAASLCKPLPEVVSKGAGGRLPYETRKLPVSGYEDGRGTIGGVPKGPPHDGTGGMGIWTEGSGWAVS